MGAQVRVSGGSYVDSSSGQPFEMVPGGNDGASSTVVAQDFDGDGDIDVLMAVTGGSSVVWDKANLCGAHLGGSGDPFGDRDILCPEYGAGNDDGHAGCCRNIRNFEIKPECQAGAYGVNNPWRDCIVPRQYTIAWGAHDRHLLSKMKNHLYLNSGTGEFTAADSPITTESLLSMTRDFGVGDIDNDGDIDIIFSKFPQMAASSGNSEPVGTGFGSLHFYMNDGSGGFEDREKGKNGAEEFRIRAAEAGKIELADVDNDGDLDMLVIGSGNYWDFDEGVALREGDPSWLLGASYTAPNGIPLAYAGSKSHMYDSHPQCCVANPDTSPAYIGGAAGTCCDHNGNWAVNWAWWCPYDASISPNPNNPTRVRDCSLLQDGVTPSGCTSSWDCPGMTREGYPAWTQIFINDGTGQVRLLGVIDARMCHVPRNLSRCACAASDRLCFTCCLQFTWDEANMLNFHSRGANAVAFADLDGDSDLDAIFACETANLLYVNDGSGQFTELTDAFIKIRGYGYPEPKDFNSYAVSVTDFDGDGLVDVFFGNQQEYSELYVNTGKIPLSNYTFRATGLKDDFTEAYVTGNNAHRPEWSCPDGDCTGHDVTPW